MTKEQNYFEPCDSTFIAQHASSLMTTLNSNIVTVLVNKNLVSCVETLHNYFNRARHIFKTI